MPDLYASSSYEEYTPDSFIVGGLIAFKEATLTTGQNLTKGTVVGRVAATGNLVISVQSATDGSQNPIGALNHDCDATAAAQSCMVVTGGDLNKSQVTFDASWSAVQQQAAFDRTPINLVTVE